MKVLRGMTVASMARTCLVVGLSSCIYSACAQQVEQTGQMNHAKAGVPSTQLVIRGPGEKSITLNPADVGALPHKTVSVYNQHTKANEKYSGVALMDLLKKVDTPSGENVRGQLFMTAVVAEGTDHYSVLFALAEVDPTIHTGDVVVADSVDGHSLGKDGAFKLVSTEERRPARWVRNLTQIAVINVKP